MADHNNSDDDQITKPKTKKALVPRSEAQKEATARMMEARKAKLEEKKAVTTPADGKKLSKIEEKKLYLQAIKDKLNNAPPASAHAAATDDEESEEEVKPQPKPKPKTDTLQRKNKVPEIHIPSESEDTEEEEIIVVKKKSKKTKKPKKKTIIVEASSDEEEEEEEPEEPPTPRVVASRPTKSQMNKHTRASLPPPPAPQIQRPQMTYYFAD